MIRMLEKGSADSPTVLLLLGDSRQLTDAAERLQEHYHLIVPILERSAKAEQALEDGIKEINTYVRDRYQGSIYAVCGLFGSWPLMKRLLTDTEIVPLRTVAEERDTVPGTLILSELQS